MKRRDRNSYWNVAARTLMRLQTRIEYLKNNPGPESSIVLFTERRLLESTLEAVRFKYGQPSSWDYLFTGSFQRYTGFDCISISGPSTPG